jgi:hypothetical protein
MSRRRNGETGGSKSFVPVVLAVGIFVLGGIGATAAPSAARAADDPVPTTPEPEPDPTPDPYTPAPKPKPKPTPAPAPRSQPAPARAPVVTQTPAAPTVAPSRTSAPKPARKKNAQRTKVTKKKAKPIPAAPKAAQAAVPVKKTVAIVTPSETFDSAMLVLLGMIGLAFACLALAAIPATYVRWRPAAHFVATRNLDLAIVGLALLLLAGFTFLVTGGS